MKIVIASGNNSNMPASTEVPGFSTDNLIIPAGHASSFVNYPDADAFIDLAFDGVFYSPSYKPILINETTRTFDEIAGCPYRTGRFCGWPGFKERKVWEIATNTIDNIWLSRIMYHIGKEYELVADKPGLVAPRILSTIINEAMFANADGVSTTEEIDLAMKLGTNYPKGPIEWANSIGTKRIFDLLEVLQKTDERYKPHPLLKN